MKTRTRLAGLLAAVTIVAALGVVAIQQVGAHVGVDHLESCSGVSADVASFPTGQSPVTIQADAANDGGSIIDTVTGPADTAAATWLQLGVNPEAGGIHDVTYSWPVSVDGGGHYGPFVVDLSECVPETTTVPPTTTTTVEETTTTTVEETTTTTAEETTTTTVAESTTTTADDTTTVPDTSTTCVPDGTSVPDGSTAIACNAPPATPVEAPPVLAG